MANGRRRNLSTKQKIRRNVASGRKNKTRTRTSWSPQTVATGGPQQKDLTGVTVGAPSNWWLNRETEVAITRIRGYVGYTPNLNEENVSPGTPNGYFQSWAAYCGLVRVDQDQAGNGVATCDPFNDPDFPWCWIGTDKGVILLPDSVSSSVTFWNGMGPAPGRVWNINMELQMVLSLRQRLIFCMNYTDDGAIDNSSWFGALFLDVRY